MRVRYFNYFIAVAEEQSFSRAAARVHIEPSPLSRAIRELESQLGVRLLHRNKGRIQLTWRGEIFYEEARRIVESVEAAKFRVRSASRRYRGRLNLGLADSLAQPQLSQLLACCREEEPNTDIRITEMTVGEMRLAIQRRQIDAGFTLDDEFMADCVKKIVWTERPTIAVPARHPLLDFDEVPLSEALHYSLILFHPDRCAGAYKTVHQWIRNSQLPPPKVAEYVTGHETMMMLVAAGYGIGIGLESQTSLYNHPDVRIRPMPNTTPEVPTFVVTCGVSPAAPELERFIRRAQQIGTRP